MFLELVTEVACCNLELFMLLRKCVGLCFEAAFDFELRRKGLDDTFGLWNFAF
ncbi:uncharacterized protein DS421_4g118540 [Arachis hypogaea]|nr:uncharacterized protein DS421_4g118540 [Arachis hypogaea]